MGNNLDSESKAFSIIQTARRMLEYLESPARYNRNVHYFHHYTTLDTAIDIFQNQEWHLAKANKMNDALEYNSGDVYLRDNFLYSSFMGKDTESIAMWSMYGQPWERGVKITFPRDAVKNWLSEITEVHEISLKNKKPTGNSCKISKGDLKIVTVAYTNCHDTFDEDNKQVIQWSNKTNEHVSLNPNNFGILTGYIKNKAWSYEKEFRIKLNTNSELLYERVAIDIPDSVIKATVLTPSPMFKGDFREEVDRTIKRKVRIKESIFHGRLKIDTFCNRCKHGEYIAK